MIMTLTLRSPDDKDTKGNANYWVISRDGINITIRLKDLCLLWAVKVVLLVQAMGASFGCDFKRYRSLLLYLCFIYLTGKRKIKTYLVGNKNVLSDAESTNENKSCLEAICLASVLSS